MTRVVALVVVFASLAAVGTAHGQDAPVEEVRTTPPVPLNGSYGPPPPPLPPRGTVAKAPAVAQDKGSSGWVPGNGFMVRSEDTPDYALRIGFQGGYKFEPLVQDGDWQNRRNFFVLRPIFAGHLFRKWIRFWTSLELNSNPPFLLDSYVEIQPKTEFGVRLGQQYTLFSRHEQYGPQQILFPEWAPVAEYFWTGRDKGATVWGALAEGKFEYYAGAYGGSPLRQFVSIAGNYMFEGRLVWNPLGPTGSTEFPYISDEAVPFRVSTSLQGYYGKVQLAEENFNPSSFRFEPMATGMTRKQAAGSVDLFIQSAHLAFLSEAVVRKTDPDITMSGDSYTSVGIWGQLGVLVVPRTADVGIRVNWLNASTSLSNDQLTTVEGMVGWYISHSHNLVLRARYGYGDQKSPGTAALGPVTLFTKPGVIHIGTLQLNVAF